MMESRPKVKKPVISFLQDSLDLILLLISVFSSEWFSEFGNIILLVGRSAIARGAWYKSWPSIAVRSQEDQFLSSDYLKFIWKGLTWVPSRSLKLTPISLNMNHFFWRQPGWSNPIPLIGVTRKYHSKNSFSGYSKRPSSVTTIWSPSHERLTRVLWNPAAG